LVWLLAPGFCPYDRQAAVLVQRISKQMCLCVLYFLCCCYFFSSFYFFCSEGALKNWAGCEQWTCRNCWYEFPFIYVYKVISALGCFRKQLYPSFCCKTNVILLSVVFFFLFPHFMLNCFASAPPKSRQLRIPMLLQYVEHMHSRTKGPRTDDRRQKKLEVEVEDVAHARTPWVDSIGVGFISQDLKSRPWAKKMSVRPAKKFSKLLCDSYRLG